MSEVFSTSIFVHYIIKLFYNIIIHYKYIILLTPLNFINTVRVFPYLLKYIKIYLFFFKNFT